MTSTLSPPTQAEFFEEDFPTAVRLGPADAKNNRFSRTRPSRGRRAFSAFVRFLITLGIGIGGTLAWQSYGDQARQIIATAYPEQLGWVAPQAATPASGAQNASATVASPDASAAVASPAPAPSIDPQELNRMSLGLASMRQDVDRLAAQLAFGQQQMAGDIAKLQASEQDILNKISAPPPRPAAPPVRRPALLTPPQQQSQAPPVR
jgi:hypothetical protein